MSFAGSLLGWSAFYGHARGKGAAMLPKYQTAYEKGMDNPTHLCAYGLLLMQNERAKEAVPILEKARDSKKLKGRNVVSAYTNLGIAYWKVGDIDAAVDTLKQVFEKTPTTNVYATLGYFLIEQARQKGDYEEALAFNKKALDYDDEDPVILDNMGQIYALTQAYEKAIPYLEKALKVKPDQVDSKYYLALCLYHTGDLEGAYAYAEEAVNGTYKPMSTVKFEQAEALYAEIQGKMPPKTLAAGKGEVDAED